MSLPQKVLATALLLSLISITDVEAFLTSVNGGTLTSLTPEQEADAFDILIELHTPELVTAILSTTIAVVPSPGIGALTLTLEETSPGELLLCQAVAVVGTKVLRAEVQTLAGDGSWTGGPVTHDSLSWGDFLTFHGTPSRTEPLRLAIMLTIEPIQAPTDPRQQLALIANRVQDAVNSGSILNAGIGTSLTEPLAAIQASLDQGHVQAALGQLTALLQHLEAQGTRGIELPLANALSQDVRAVIATLEGAQPGNGVASFGVAPTSNSIIVGDRVDFVLVARNAQGGIARTFAGIVTLSSSDPHIQGPREVEFRAEDQGVVRARGFRFQTPGAQELVASLALPDRVTQGTAVFEVDRDLLQGRVPSRMGDLNADNRVDAVDLGLFDLFSGGAEVPTAMQLYAADFDRDGRLSNADRSSLLAVVGRRSSGRAPHVAFVSPRHGTALERHNIHLELTLRDSDGDLDTPSLAVVSQRRLLGSFGGLSVVHPGADILRHVGRSFTSSGSFQATLPPNVFGLGEHELMALVADRNGNIAWSKVAFEAQGISLLAVDELAPENLPAPLVAVAFPENLVETRGPASWSVSDGTGFFTDPTSAITELVALSSQDLSAVTIKPRVHLVGAPEFFDRAVLFFQHAPQTGPQILGFNFNPGSPTTGGRFASGGVSLAPADPDTQVILNEQIRVTLVEVPEGVDREAVQRTVEVEGTTFIFRVPAPGLYVVEISGTFKVSPRDTRDDPRDDRCFSFGPTRIGGVTADGFKRFIDEIFDRICKLADEMDAAGAFKNPELRETKELFEQFRNKEFERFTYNPRSQAAPGSHFAGQVVEALRKAELTPFAFSSSRDLIRTILHEMRHMAQLARLAAGLPDRDVDGVDNDWDPRPTNVRFLPDRRSRDAEEDADRFAETWVDRVEQVRC